MPTFTKRYARDLYRPELKMLVDEGEYVEVRDRKTLEVMNTVSEITEPQHHCILIPERKWNPWLALSEALWILSGRDDVAALRPYNNHIADYSDDGIHLYGAYGARMFGQIDSLINRLKEDPSDRRAVLQIWNHFDPLALPDRNSSDLTEKTKDPPCNNLVYFKLRNKKLHMTVINRSNDIHYGLFAVNIPTFGILQEYIAARLGVELGTQTHLSNSLHVYTDEKQVVDITDRMLYGSKYVPVYPEHERAFTDLTNIKSHSDFAQMCSDVLDHKYVYVPDWPDFLNFSNDFLSMYPAHKAGLDIADKWPNLGKTKYRDWVLAGSIFTGVNIL